MLNVTGHLPATKGDILEGFIDKICVVGMDDVVIWGEMPEAHLKRLLAILDRLLERGCYSAVHKAALSLERKSSAVGKLFSERR